MSETRDSRCSSNDKLIVYLNGVPLPKEGRVAAGCVGESVIFTTTTTLVEPVTYKWSLDGISPPKPLLSTDSFYNYTFDNKTHELYLVAKGGQCSIQLTIDVIGKICIPICPISCKSESVNIPIGQLKYLVDDIGVKHMLQGFNYVECKADSKSNLNTTQSIIDTIRLSTLKCDTSSLEVNLRQNFSQPNCMTLTIRNSPIKFAYAVINTGYYSFNTRNC